MKLNSWYKNTPFSFILHVIHKHTTSNIMKYHTYLLIKNHKNYYKLDWNYSTGLNFQLFAMWFRQKCALSLNDAQWWQSYSESASCVYFLIPHLYWSFWSLHGLIPLWPVSMSLIFPENPSSCFWLGLLCQQPPWPNDPKISLHNCARPIKEDRGS